MSISTKNVGSQTILLKLAVPFNTISYNALLNKAKILRNQKLQNWVVIPR
jgi:hypothetical protein